MLKHLGASRVARSGFLAEVMSICRSSLCCLLAEGGRLHHLDIKVSMCFADPWTRFSMTTWRLLCQQLALLIFLMELCKA